MSLCMFSDDELIISNILPLYRYLVWLEVFLTNIDRSHPRCKRAVAERWYCSGTVSDPWLTLCSGQDDGGDIYEICKVR